MKKITTIPKHVSDQFPALVSEAIQDGLRCAPADRPRAEAGLRAIYRAAGLNHDVPIIWVPCPLVGSVAAGIAKGRGSAVDSAVDSAVYPAVDSAVRSAVYSAVYPAVDSAVYSAVGSAVDSAVRSAVDSAVRSAVYSAVYPAVDSAVRSAVDSAVGSAVRSAVYSAVGSAVGSAVDSAVDSAVRWHDRRGGQFWISWPAFVDAISRLGVDHPSFVAIRAEHDVCRSAGWYWPNKNWIMVSERPQAIRTDDAGRLHCESGPAVDYGDTFRMYSWHGTAIPSIWIEARDKLDAATALAWPNVEQRRAACEILGWARVLSSLNARTIDTHENPMVGTLVEVDLPDSGPERFLRVLCGTGREFALPVPREVRTALGAQAWTWGLDAKSFKTPEVRT